MSRELRLLSVCRKTIAEEDEIEIRNILGQPIDWTLFAQAAIERGVVNEAAGTLLRVAPDLIPDDILGAMRTILERAQSRNRDLLKKVAQTIEGEPATGVAAQAYTTADKALSVNPSDASAWHSLGGVFSELGQHETAIACYSRALELAPERIEAWIDRARALSATGKVTAALADIDKALALDGRNTRAWVVRGQILLTVRSFAEAGEASDRALALDPGNLAAKRVGIQSRLFVCDWHRRAEDKHDVSEGLKAGRSLISPVHHRVLSDSEAEQFVLAGLRARSFPPVPKALWGGEAYRHDKIRVAYMSTDFRDHVVADAIAGCLELHDRTHFETTGISLGRNDRSPMRRRMEGAFDRFVDMQARSDAEVAAAIRALEIDILIDLNGYSGDARTKILAFRPAPVQACYFGYPGTMALPYFDYIIADSWLIPAEHRIYYTEQVVYLPYTYLPSDRKRPLGAEVPSRAEAGLPATGFVFACLHNAFKIGPEIFDVWTRLLRDVKGSIMWLLADGERAIANLKREATLRGIDPERLIFAPRRPLAEHIARLKLGDLYLDTIPYCAHTSASDALWAGLPVLTCPGNTFAGRVAAPLLHAIGLPELVVESLAEYEDLARGLAQDPDRLAGIKARLGRNRDTYPLFDTARFTRDLEAAYRVMRQRQRSGLPPETFAVRPSA